MPRHTTEVKVGERTVARTPASPASPPAAPVIPIGLATRLGQFGTALLTLATVLTTILPGDHSGETKTYAILGTVIAAVTIIGRMLQSAAALARG